MTELTIYNVQQATTLKVGKPELQFVGSGNHLMMLNISIKFLENISNAFQVT